MSVFLLFDETGDILGELARFANPLMDPVGRLQKFDARPGQLSVDAELPSSASKGHLPLASTGHADDGYTSPRDTRRTVGFDM
jgi:hypothetical protein